MIELATLNKMSTMSNVVLFTNLSKSSLLTAINAHGAIINHLGMQTIP